MRHRLFRHPDREDAALLAIWKRQIALDGVLRSKLSWGLAFRDFTGQGMFPERFFEYLRVVDSEAVPEEKLRLGAADLVIPIQQVAANLPLLDPEIGVFGQAIDASSSSSGMRASLRRVRTS